jgi:UDP-glucose 4-epimerase
MTICLVTGGGGFIGSHIVEALVKRGDQVRVLDNFSSGHLDNLANVHNHIEIIEGDIRDPTTVHEAVRDIELIFHLAALVSVPESMGHPLLAEAINAAGTLNVLIAAEKAGARRVIFSSTCAIYGDDPSLPAREIQCPAPKSPYAIAKLAAEGYCQVFSESLGLETVILRYFNVYGPRQDPSSPYSGVISIFVDRMLKGQPLTIFGSGEQTRDFVYVSDVVQANLLAGDMLEAAGYVFNIGRGQQVSINQLFRQLKALLGSDLEENRVPARSGDIMHSCADPSRAAEVLNWQATVSLEEGLRRLLALDPSSAT